MMNSRHSPFTNENAALLNELEGLIATWEINCPSQQKFSKKINGTTFSLLKDIQGRYYVMDNDNEVTKSAESNGTQGKYKKLFSLIRNHSNQLEFSSHVEGVKIERIAKKEFQSASNDHLFYSFFNYSKPVTPIIEKDSIEEDIFGPIKPLHKGDEITALKKLGLYIDDFLFQNKKYILLRHVEGIQLLKFVEKDFLKLTSLEQIEAFTKIMKSCIQALQKIHRNGVAHNDAQLKNFIKDHDSFHCTAIDLGSAQIKATTGRMENDFLILTNECFYFDRYFNIPALAASWLTFKQEFQSIPVSSQFSTRSLLFSLDSFSSVAQQKLSEEKANNSFLK